MSSVSALLGMIAAFLIVAGIYIVSPMSVAIAAVLEMSGVVLAVAFFGLIDGT